MRLYAYVLEAKDLPVTHKSYAKLQVGSSKTKTRTLECSGSDPVWNEEFVFRVHDIADELVVSVYARDEEDDQSVCLVGRLRIPVRSLTREHDQRLSPTWFDLQNPNSGLQIKHNCGKILLAVSLNGRGDVVSGRDVSVDSFSRTRDSSEIEDSSTNTDPDCSTPRTRKYPHRRRKLLKAFTNHFEKLLRKNGESCKSDESSDISTTPSVHEDGMAETSLVHSSFEEAMNTMISRGSEQEMPEDLDGGVLVDQVYMLSSTDLNTLLFAPESQFRKDLAQVQGITDMDEGRWTWKLGEISSLTRVVTYTKPPSKLVRECKATEEQTYVKADSGQFAVRVYVDTPDVPYGNTFRTEILYKIYPGTELASDEESSRLVVSWQIKFNKSTMMKGMIEGGARQGLKENFDQFSTVLAQHAKVLSSSMESIEKDNVLETLDRKRVSDSELAAHFFWSPTVVFAIFMLLYVLVHMLLCERSMPQGLEINGLDLPDSFGELITSGILIILLQHVHKMVSHFIGARIQMGSDHGVRAQGDGWVVTVAVIEAVNLADLDSSGPLDPFVVLTCNAKTRTSSVQLQTCDPQWNEVLEFDATEEPPSVLDVEVFDFDGPFDQASSLGHAEINFLKHTSNELADLWIPLEGTHAMSSQSKLHLRIILENNNGVDTVKDYLTKMEKEVGKKLDIRSPHKNSAFQKMFGLPPEEFLMKDYLCYLRRKFLLQGRLFLSARIIGFHGNLFRQKTNFFFLWEDIEDIEVLPPSLASIGSPTLVIVLRKGRGEDAMHGAKSQDNEGRLRFYFQSFASFDVTSRTIKALWKAKAFVPDNKALLTEDLVDEENHTVPMEKTEHVDSLDANMNKIYSTDLPIDMNSVLEIFDGGLLEQKVMARSGCLDYKTSQWETIKSQVEERRVSYRFSRHVSVFGGQVNCSQRKSPLREEKGWVIDEFMVLQGVPFSDNFHVHVRYRIEEHDEEKEGCECGVFLGIEWLKSNKFRQRITRNIDDKFAVRFKEIFELVKKEILVASDRTPQH